MNMDHFVMFNILSRTDEVATSTWPLCAPFRNPGFAVAETIQVCLAIRALIASERARPFVSHISGVVTIGIAFGKAGLDLFVREILFGHLLDASQHRVSSQDLSPFSSPFIIPVIEVG